MTKGGFDLGGQNAHTLWAGDIFSGLHNTVPLPAVEAQRR